MTPSLLPDVPLECCLERTLTKSNNFVTKASGRDSQFRPGTEQGGTEVTHFSSSRVKPYSRQRKAGISFSLGFLRRG